MPVEMYEQPKDKTMIVEITKQTVAKLRIVKPGEILELPEAEARVLLCYHKAKKYESLSVVEAVDEKPSEKKATQTRKNKGE
jgi:hypothetical protein